MRPWPPRAWSDGGASAGQDRSITLGSDTEKTLIMRLRSDGEKVVCNRALLFVPVEIV